MVIMGNVTNINTWNKVYSEGRSLLIWPDENVVASLHRNKSDLQKGLDIACGAGRHTILMSQLGIESIGIDSSNAAIEFATKRSKELGLNNVTFINDIVQNLDFLKDTFDIVIAWGIMHYLKKEDRQQLLQKIKEVLKPNGILLCTLRSTEDSRIEEGKKISDNTYLVDYFDSDSDNTKQTEMYFWDEDEVRTFLKDFSDIKLGHRILEPIGHLSKKSAHWLIEAKK